jgi:hypothetical protein
MLHLFINLLFIYLIYYTWTRRQLMFSDNVKLFCLCKNQQWSTKPFVIYTVRSFKFMLMASLQKLS